MIHAVEEADNVNCIVFDGIITQRLIDAAVKSGVRSIYGIRPGEINRKGSDMLIYTS
ncbi:hypothetical protein B1B_05992, partial [mine drainage metagenome]